MLESLGKVSQSLPTRLHWRIFSIWAPRWRLEWEKVYVRFQKVNADYQIYSIYLSMHNSAQLQKSLVVSFSGKVFSLRREIKPWQCLKVYSRNSLLCRRLTWDVAGYWTTRIPEAFKRIRPGRPDQQRYKLVQMGIFEACPVRS